MRLTRRPRQAQFRPQGLVLDLFELGVDDVVRACAASAGTVALIGRTAVAIAAVRLARSGLCLLGLRVHRLADLLDR